MGWLSTALIILVVGGLVAVHFGVPLQDLLSGFFLLAERQLTVGDVVKIPAARSAKSPTPMPVVIVTTSTTTSTSPPSPSGPTPSSP